MTTRSGCKKCILANMDDYKAFAVQIAKKAGVIMREQFGAAFDEKEKREAVTAADRTINTLLITEVTKTYPTHSIYGEEESIMKESPFTWVCDPIDGTLHFVTRTPLSCFSLALCKDGQPQLGVIYDVFSDRLLTAVKGEGAFMNGEPLKVSAKDLAPNTVIDEEWWPFCGYDIVAPIHELSQKTKAYVMKIGSTVHATTLVARGEFAAVVFPGTDNKCMDIAAAKVIVEEAGGKVTDLQGNEQRYDTGTINGAIVSNGIVHDALVAAVKNAARM